MNTEIITLITDFGLQDAYVGAMKGVIVQVGAGAVICAAIASAVLTGSDAAAVSAAAIAGAAAAYIPMPSRSPRRRRRSRATCHLLKRPRAGRTRTRIETWR